ncbi:MAG: hypothetical protein O2780_12465 [Proteobacteria bacterium]|nr:hypothetical protein [Pseudomonadota bacterium]
MNARQTAIRKALRAIAAEEFRYGQTDCCQFAARVAQEITGIDYARLFYYNSERAAQSIVDEFGSLEVMVTSVLGEPSPVDDLQDGDPVLVRLPVINQDALGIRLRRHALCKTQRNVVFVPSNRIITGWGLCPAQ